MAFNPFDSERKPPENAPLRKAIVPHRRAAPPFTRAWWRGRC
jgi:hypothetical protein